MNPKTIIAILGLATVIVKTYADQEEEKALKE